ncbi:MAG: OmpA family protein [Bacteroidia bacterium]
MNKHLLTTLIASIFLMLDVSAQSSDFKYGIELNGGLREYNGDRGSTMYFASGQSFNYQAMGLGFNYYLNPSFDATMYASIGDLGYYDKEGLGFRARITDVVFGLNYKFNNGYLMSEDAAFKPYIRAGWGGMQSVARIIHGIPGWSQSRTWFASHWSAGIGARIRLTPTIDLQIQEMYNYSFDDNYDGLPFQWSSARLNVGTDGNKPLHDAYLYHSIGFVYSFGGSYSGGSPSIKDNDNDGIPNSIDLCPKTPEGAEVDSVGCSLDTDGDGVVDEADDCPTVAGVAQFNGCPDTDSDGVPDSKDKCVDVPGVIELDGCPDSDKDGIIDSEDKCPLIAGTVEGEGCPDTDGDGVYDHKDICPTVPGIVENKGCPAIEEEVVEQIRLAAKGIFFETGKDAIKAESFENLDKLVEILNTYPGAKVKIEGHTDDVGEDADNLLLSQNRADAVKRYMVTKGVEESRMTATGYGETQPIADNGSAEGRALNRRVDFKLEY